MWGCCAMQNDTRQPKRIAEIASYHAHIYYDAAKTKHEAEILRRQIGERFVVRVGNWHDELVGPHLKSMYQIAFAREVFPQLVPWLMLNHRGLSILVHPNTDRPRDDHLVHALWIGKQLPLKGDSLPETLGVDEEPEMLGPNTKPNVTDI
jgi:DOPA 4,5-dioxygenase